MCAAQAIQRLGPGLAVEVDQGFDQADPGRDLGVRPGPELAADRIDDGLRFDMLALARQVDAALPPEVVRETGARYAEALRILTD